MKKGFTLVEVLVAFACFAIALSMISITFAFTRKMEERSDSYIHFEAICLDIDAYSDKYGSMWATKYFGTDDTTIYYSEKYEITTSDNAKYTLEYEYVSNELIVNIKYITNDRYIIKDLNYGARRYE